MRTAFTDVRVFDGEEVLPATTVVVDDGLVAGVGASEPPAGIHRTVDGTGRTLLPGLVDSHVHARPEDLVTAVRFGITTVLDMGGPSSVEDRATWGARPDSADVLGAGQPVTAPHGHPTQLFARRGDRASVPPRAGVALDGALLEALGRSLSTWDTPFDDALAGVAAFDAAGVDVLVGTDASVAVPTTGGQAHGASVHHEMALLVEAGFSPVRALRAATAVPARRFGLDDRGRIVVGLRADLVLVDHDPTTTIGDSLSIVGVWRGVREVVAGPGPGAL